MEIDKIKEGNQKVLKLEAIQAKIKSLNNTKNVDSVRIRRQQSGAEKYSYDVLINDNIEFLKTLKSLIKDKLERDEQKLMDEILKM